MYRKLIASILAEINRSDVSPRLVEAWMRLEHGTLDGLRQPEFKIAVMVSVRCIDDTTEVENEALARGYGL